MGEVVRGAAAGDARYEAPGTSIAHKSYTYDIPSELSGTYWAQIVGDASGRARGPVGPVQKGPLTSGSFKKGRTAPKPGELDAIGASEIYRYGGTKVSEADGEKLAKMGWTYGQPAPKGFEYNEMGVLVNPVTRTEHIARGIADTAGMAAIAASGGTLAPWLGATISGGSALASAKLKGASWKQALIAGAAGAASSALASSAAPTAIKAGGQAAISGGNTAVQGGGLRAALANAAVAGGSAAASPTPKGGGTMATPAAAPASTPSLTNYLVQAGLGAMAGAAAGGGGTAGALLGAAQGVAGASTGQSNTQAAVGAGATLASRILSGAAAAGQAAGSVGAAREAGRQNEAGNIVTQDQQRLQATTAKENALQGRAGIDLSQRQDSRAADNNAYRNALLSALALNTRDVTANRPKGVPMISFSGGARPSAIGPEGRQAAEVMNRRALDQLMNPSPSMELPEMESFTPSALPKASGVDTALGVGGMIGNVLAGFQANQQAAQRSSLIESLMQQAQQQAQQGVSVPAQAQRPRTVQDEADEISRRVAGGA